MTTTNAVRVILLLDLDCFYAQCERVRLGLDSETCSLALLQWNSALAVTYPARRFGIKRGDSWEAVSQKSKGDCLAIHLPLLQANTCVAAAATLSAGTIPEEQESAAATPHDIEQAYDKTFRLTPEQREVILKQEVGKQRFPSEGKACLERYRLASTRIFGVVLETLEQRLQRGNFVLERASIDELFLDVTDYCNKSNDDDDDEILGETTDLLRDTNTVGVEADASSCNDADVVKALQRGCRIAKMVRQSVLDELGFTLSAGISTSKLVAKLGATYGKPNGQAVIFPHAIPTVMDEMPIRKVRNFGGKAGKQVVTLLPEGTEPTMGNLTKLSLPQLSQALGPEMAKRVFDNARGVDQEEVRETVGALVKSITAFKSFYAAALDSDQVLQWIQLLATDVCHRVQQDSHRNSRFPKSCNIQYAMRSSQGGAERRGRTTKSLRIGFPKESPSRQEELVTRVKEGLIQREGPSVMLVRLGLAAIEFEVRMTHGGIASFFGKKQDTTQLASPTKESRETSSSPEGKNDAEFAKRMQQEWNEPIRTNDVIVADKDMELAKKLQARYDRENSLHSAMEQRSKPAKRTRIDAFFARK